MSADFGSRVVAKLLDGLAVLAVVCPIAWVVSRLVPEGFGMVVAILLVLVGGSLLFGVRAFEMLSKTRVVRAA